MRILAHVEMAKLPSKQIIASMERKNRKKTILRKAFLPTHSTGRKISCLKRTLATKLKITTFPELLCLTLQINRLSASKERLTSCANNFLDEKNE